MVLTRKLVDEYIEISRTVDGTKEVHWWEASEEAEIDARMSFCQPGTVVGGFSSALSAVALSGVARMHHHIGHPQIRAVIPGNLNIRK